VSQLLRVRYGAYELKSKYQRGMMIGTCTATSVVLMILAAAYIHSALGPEMVNIEVDEPVLIESSMELPIQKSLKMEWPTRGVAAAKAPPVVGAMPVMVEDDEFIDEELSLPTQRDMIAWIDSRYPTGDGEQGSGIIVDRPVDSEYIPPMDEFRILEIDPKMIHAAKPEYPRLARIAGLEGIVWIGALVDKNGNVMKAVVYRSSGVRAGFDEAALAAAYKCKYQPGIQNGYPVIAWVAYRVQFTLEDAD
jgi:TonB family protein